MTDQGQELSERERAALYSEGFPEEAESTDESDGYECEHCGADFDTLTASRGHECPEQRAAEARVGEIEERGIVGTQVHELGAHLCFADDRDGMSPYFAVVSQWDDVMDAKGEIVLEDVAGADWILADDGTRYWSGGIAAEGESYDTFNEYQIRLVAADSLAEEEARKIVFQVRPSLPDAETPSGDRIKSMPADLPEGVRVQVNSDNVHPDDVTAILRATMGEFGIRRGYFLDRKLHEPSCNIYNLARYVRIERPVAEQLITSENALLERLARFGSQRGGRGEHTWDHGEIEGHREAVAMDAGTWSKLVDGREIGTLLKSYHMANPEKQASDAPTSHPKLEVQYSTEYSDRDVVPWTADGYDRHDLLDELDETLVNCLHWAGINLEADDPAYVADEYFGADPDPRELRLVDDPIEIVEDVEADLAASQFHAADLTEAELRAFRTAVEEGEQHYEQLAERSGTSKSTIYRMFDKVDGVLRRMNGRFTAGDDVIRERLEGLFQAIDRATEMAGRELGEIVDDAREIPEDSPFSRWMQRYGVHLRDLPPEEKPTQVPGEEWIELDVHLGQWTDAEIKRILREGGLAARETSKRLLAQLTRAIVSYRDVEREGQRRTEWVGNWMGDDLRVGGFSML